MLAGIAGTEILSGNSNSNSDGKQRREGRELGSAGRAGLRSETVRTYHPYNKYILFKAPNQRWAGLQATSHREGGSVDSKLTRW
jgi:hypothetical protein